MSRHNGRKTLARAQCPCCGRLVSHNILRTIAIHHMLKGVRCPASLDNATRSPERFIVERRCPLCAGLTYSPTDGCCDPMHHRPVVCS